MSNTTKILLVDDDDLFRSIVKKSLQAKGCEVTDLSDGRIAKDKLLSTQFDLVISDIQMPHFSGLDLLEWIKEHQTIQVPVVLMTGFALALETKKAYEMGGCGFLAKPFRESDLHEILIPYLKQDLKQETVIERPPIDLDKEFCKIDVENFLSEKETECSIYLRLSKTRYIKISHVGGKISDDRIKTYKEKGVHYVYVKKEDFSKIVKFNLQIAKLAKKSDSISHDKKVNLMKHTGELLLEQAFVTGVNEEVFSESKNFIETSMNLLTEDDQLASILNLLSTHADFLYTHSLGVSIFSVMIARKIGWASTPVLFKLTLGGLFHDIGKKEIEKEILEKPRPLLSLKERSIIESHPLRGKEILEALGSMPSEVALIAYEHHEDNLGLGFPRGLKRREIHPLTKVVQVANLFCAQTIKYLPGVEPIPPPAAIEKMNILLQDDRIDKIAFEALKNLF